MLAARNQSVASPYISKGCRSDPTFGKQSNMGFFGSLWSGMKSFGKSVKKGLSKAASVAWDVTKQVGSTAKNLVNSGASAVKSVGSGAGTAIADVGAGVKGLGTGIGSGIGSIG